jgi:biotin carboxylase
MAKKRVAIIGAGEFQIPLVKRCNELQYETHVFAWEEGAVAKEFAHQFHSISIVEIDAILKECKQLQIVGVFAIASELAMKTVSTIANELGLISNSIESAELTQNKQKMKKAFLENDIPCAKGNGFSSVNEGRFFAEELLKNGSVILKPSDRSGSLAISKLEDLVDFEGKFSATQKRSFSKSVIIEEFIGGDEYSVETVTQNGVHQVIAITKKTNSGAPHFVEISHQQPAILSDDIEEQLNTIIKKALTALLITNGISHCEIKIDDEEIKIIEIGGRMGGDYIGSHLTPLSTGVNLIDTAIDIWLGKQINLNILIIKKTDFINISFIYSKSKGLVMDSQQISIPNKPVIESSCLVKKGDKVELITSSCKRFGYIIYGGSLISNQEALDHFGIKIIL